MNSENPAVLTREDPRWEEFSGRLAFYLQIASGAAAGPPSFDFIMRGCDNTINCPQACKVLTEMGFDVAGSLVYFNQHGGYCDCEILLNVEHAKT